MKESPVFTVLLIDDYPIALKGLHHFLTQQLVNWTIMACKHIIPDGGDENCKPDVIILGINTSNVEENLHYVKLCNIHFPSVPIIIYDHKTQYQTIRPYFFCGVRGYILKEKPTDEILECIKDVMSGKFYMEPEIMNVLLQGDVKPRNPVSSRRSNKLSTRETEIASYLSDGNGTAWIAQKLLLKPSTISNTKRNIFAKMKVQNTIQLKEAMRSAAAEWSGISS